MFFFILYVKCKLVFNKQLVHRCFCSRRILPGETKHQKFGVSTIFCLFVLMKTFIQQGNINRQLLICSNNLMNPDSKMYQGF